MSDELASNLVPFPEEGGDGQQETGAGRPGHIPPHVWNILQQAGETAAQRLNDLLLSPGFQRLKVSEQTKLIELGLNRAYGPPIKREVTVSLSGDLGDAVEASLAELSTAQFPELKDVTPEQPQPDAAPRQYVPRRARKGQET